MGRDKSSPHWFWVLCFLYIAERFAGWGLLVHHPKKHIRAMQQGCVFYMAWIESTPRLKTVRVIKMQDNTAWYWFGGQPWNCLPTTHWCEWKDCSGEWKDLWAGQMNEKLKPPQLGSTVTFVKWPLRFKKVGSHRMYNRHEWLQATEAASLLSTTLSARSYPSTAGRVVSYRQDWRVPKSVKQSSGT